MISNHKKYDLFGMTLIEKLVVISPFEVTIPVTDNACFIYMLEGEMRYQIDDERIDVPAKHSVLLNCINFGIPLSNLNPGNNNQLVIVHFHPAILKKIYDREFPLLLQTPKNTVSN